jgi:hypothetical protein
MGESANVRSLEALRHFKVAVLQFGHNIESGLTMIDQELSRALDWLEHDRPHYWKQQVRMSFEAISQARTAYDQCRLKTVAGNRSPCIEERDALRAAQDRLRIAQEKIELVKHWTINVRHEVDEYRGRISQLQQTIEYDLPRSAAILGKMIESIEAYTAIQTSGAETMPSDVGSEVANQDGNTESGATK